MEKSRIVAVLRQARGLRKDRSGKTVISARLAARNKNVNSGKEQNAPRQEMDASSQESRRKDTPPRETSGQDASKQDTLPKDASPRADLPRTRVRPAAPP